MGNCKFCGMDAGWRKESHDACKAQQIEQLAQLKLDVISAITAGEPITTPEASQFLTQAGEKVLFTLTGVGYTEMRHKETRYQSGWIFDRVYSGTLALTNKRLMFAGERSAQVLLSKVLNFTPTSLDANGTKLHGLIPETGSATRKVFIVDDDDFLMDLIEAARARGSGRRKKGVVSAAPSEAIADIVKSVIVLEPSIWNGLVAPIVGAFDQLRSFPTAELNGDSLSHTSSELATAIALSEETEEQMTEHAASGLPRASECVAALRAYRTTLAVAQGEMRRLIDLGRPVRVEDADRSERAIEGAYRELVKVLMRLDPGFEPAAGDWLARRAEEPAASSSSKPSERGKGASAQPVGTTASFKAVPHQECPDFSDVGGMEALKTQFRSTLGLVLKHREQAAALGVRFNGVLLHGPPGTGKTFIARACAGEFDCSFISVGSADIMSAYIGDSPRLVSAAFETAEMNAPVILFFDEFDALAGRRDGASADAGGVVMRQVMEQLLRNLESVRDRPDVIVMAATNRLDDLDPAVIRPGRFDLKVRVDMPDVDARKAIFTAALSRRNKDDIDYDALAEATEGTSAAGITTLIDTAALAALQASPGHRSALITMAHLNHAILARGGKDRPLTRKTTWDELVLPAETKRELQKIQALIQDPGRARLFGVTPPRGVLLYGPPGTGKTTIARVMASETQASFYALSCAELVSKWIGQSESNVAQLFERARENRPSIIFLDEIDALARKRGGGDVPGDSSLDRVVNQLLQEMDGLESAEGVFVLAATNRREIIDDALLRGGRLGRQIFVGLPDEPGRAELLVRYTATMPLAPGISFAGVATATDGWSGADLRQLAEQAAMEAMMSAVPGDDPLVTADNFSSAMSTVHRQRE